MIEPRVSKTKEILTVKIKGQNHADACYYMKEIIHCDSVRPNQSDRHTTFRFWNITATHLSKKITLSAKQMDFAS
jgi:hypothetical protein